MRTQQAERFVAGDGIEPRPDVVRIAQVLNGPEGDLECLLDGILSEGVVGKVTAAIGAQLRRHLGDERCRDLSSLPILLSPVCGSCPHGDMSGKPPEKLAAGHDAGLQRSGQRPRARAYSAGTVAWTSARRTHVPCATKCVANARRTRSFETLA